jgi:hypothetical protein
MVDKKNDPQFFSSDVYGDENKPPVAGTGSLPALKKQEASSNLLGKHPSPSKTVFG